MRGLRTEVRMGILGNLKQAVMLRSRVAKLDDFYLHCSKECNVLDVGVSSNDHSPSINLFLKTFRFPPSRYTGLAVERVSQLATQFPKHKFVEYEGKVFPFRDKEFDFVFSNAVIEHVGNFADQVRFLDEMLRTGEKVFFTTPCKYFPVESHTNAIFLHWFPAYFYRWCKRKRPYWNERNLRLLGHDDLMRLLEASQARNYTIKRNRLMGLTMTLTVVCCR